MANIIWTPPSGWVEETGAHVSFKAPCDCTSAGSLVIGNNTYSIVDALGNVMTGVGGSFVSGAVLEFILDCENLKAYLQNSAVSGIRIKTLWENASPDSNFAAQQITLPTGVNLSDYTEFIFEYGYSKSYPEMRYSTLIQVPPNATSSLTLMLSVTWKSASTSRMITMYREAVIDRSAGTITFGNGAYVDTSDSSNGSQYCVPTRIIAIKGVL